MIYDLTFSKEIAGENLSAGEGDQAPTRRRRMHAGEGDQEADTFHPKMEFC